MTNGDFIRSMSDADIRENFTQLLCEFVQRKQTTRHLPQEPLPEQGTLLPLHQGLAERRKRGA